MFTNINEMDTLILSNLTREDLNNVYRTNTKLRGLLMSQAFWTTYYTKKIDAILDDLVHHDIHYIAHIDGNNLPSSLTNYLGSKEDNQSTKNIALKLLIKENSLLTNYFTLTCVAESFFTVPSPYLKRFSLRWDKLKPILFHLLKQGVIFTTKND